MRLMSAFAAEAWSFTIRFRSDRPIHMNVSRPNCSSLSIARMTLRKASSESKGLPLTFPSTTGVPRPLTGGILVRP